MGDTQQPASQGSDSSKIFEAIQQLVSGGQQMAGPQRTGGVATPGQIVAPPAPNIQFNPNNAPSAPITTAAPQRPQPYKGAGNESIGNFATKNAATNAGLVSLGNSLGSMFTEAGNREKQKKSMMAENYLLQINGLLASGDPEDKKKAMMFLEDPKIKKTLKTGLEYVPLEEEVPPEAQGVQKAVQKIKSGQQPGGSQQPQPKPQMQPVVPQPSQGAQTQSAIASAVLQKIRSDPASALAMGGVSSLSAADQHASEFYEKGLGMSPVQVSAMTQKERLDDLKIYEGMFKDSLKAQVDFYKADKGYAGRVDTAKVLASSRDRFTDAIKANSKLKGHQLNLAAGAKVYSDMGAKYLDIVKSGKQPNGQPLTAEQKKYYEDQAQKFQQKADDMLNQSGDEDLWNEFLKATAVGGPDESEDEQ